MKHIDFAATVPESVSHEVAFREAAASPFVELPVYDGVHRYDPRVIEPLGDLAIEFAAYFGNNKDYPHAKMHLAPLPSDQFNSRLTFMVAWGKKVDRLPHPRKELLPEYFGYLSRANLKVRSKGIHLKTVLDGHGILGRVTTKADGNTELGVYMRSPSSERRIIHTIYPGPIDADAVALDAITDLALGVRAPLRFHSGIRYIPSNRYIGIEFFAGDQQTAIPLSA